MTKLGRISNGALNALQRNPKDQTEVNTSSRRVARQVLIYLESADKNAKPRYTFGNGAIPTGNSRPSNYFKNKPTSKDILIQIFHTKKGKVVAINFGKNGYMVTMIAGKEPTIVKDGNCLPSSSFFILLPSTLWYQRCEDAVLLKYISTIRSLRYSFLFYQETVRRSRFPFSFSIR